MTQAIQLDDVRRAWGRVDTTSPRRIDVLRSKASRASALYRLCAAGSGGEDVVAKLCRGEDAAIEPALYRDVLPHLPISIPHCYGTTPEEGGTWLFLEDVGGERVDPSCRAHRVLASRWLARLHASAQQRTLEDRLPRRGPAHYLERLRAGRLGIVANLDNPAFDADHRSVLEAVLTQLDQFEARWDRIEECCAEVPCTLVHGDFRPKNAHVREAAQGLTLYPMDWETAGWGVAAADLAPARSGARRHLIELDVYRAEYQACGGSIAPEVLARQVAVGVVFLQLIAIEWATRSLPFPWPDQPVGRLRWYRNVLDDALRAPHWHARAPGVS